MAEISICVSVHWKTAQYADKPCPDRLTVGRSTDTGIRLPEYKSQFSHRVKVEELSILYVPQSPCFWIASTLSSNQINISVHILLETSPTLICYTLANNFITKMKILLTPRTHTHTPNTSTRNTTAREHAHCHISQYLLVSKKVSLSLVIASSSRCRGRLLHDLLSTWF